MFKLGMLMCPQHLIIMKEEMTEFIFSQFILKVDKWINEAEAGKNDNLAADLRTFKEEILNYSKKFPGDSKE